MQMLRNVDFCRMYCLYKAATRQSLPVFFDAASELLNEAIVDGWVCCAAGIIEIYKPAMLFRRKYSCCKGDAGSKKQQQDGCVDLQRLDVHGSLVPGGLISGSSSCVH